LTGLIGSRTASGAAGTGGIAGKGFLVRETVGGGFFGMPEEYARVVAGNKARAFGKLATLCEQAVIRPRIQRQTIVTVAAAT
jgi:hypothetical protein